MMPVRNELGRYLERVLESALVYCDKLAVYDDCSDDGTFEWLCEWAKNRPVAVEQRRGDVPSFAVDESGLRQAGWDMMERTLCPSEGDWIVALDADEFLATQNREMMSDLRGVLEDEIGQARHRDGIRLPIREIFDQNEHSLLYRIDGYWGEISGARMMRWRPGLTFDPRVEGGGSLPSPQARHWNARELVLLHVGYLNEADRIEKHARYSRRAVHNPTHVASILQQPKLAEWTGGLP